MKSTLEFLTNAKSLIDTPEKWTRGVCARDSEGIAVGSINPTAVCFCSIGAIERVASTLDKGTFESATEAYLIETRSRLLLRSAMGDDSINEFNDRHDYEKVMKAWDRAIKMSKNHGYPE